MDGWVAIVDTDDDTGDTHQDCHHAALHPDHHHQYALQSQSNNAMAEIHILYIIHINEYKIVFRRNYKIILF